MDRLIHRKDYSVHVYEIGLDEKLDPVSLFNYFQDIAAEHARILGFGREEMIRMNNFWVLSRISAKVKIWPSLFEKITVTTWPAGIDRMFALRNFSVSCSDGNEIASATSSWLIVDLETRRIKRPGEEFNRYKPDFHSETQVGGLAEKIEPENNFTEKTEPSMVKMSDLDVNMHTNNASYIKWVLDSYGMEFIANHKPVGFLINFLAESKLGDEIEIRTGKKDELTFYHSVVKTDNNTELCRMITQWKNCAL